MVGYLNRATILSAWTRQMEEEGIREHGWLRQFWGSTDSERPSEEEPTR